MDDEDAEEVVDDVEDGGDGVPVDLVNAPRSELGLGRCRVGVRRGAKNAFPERITRLDRRGALL